MKAIESRDRERIHAAAVGLCWLVLALPSRGFCAETEAAAKTFRCTAVFDEPQQRAVCQGVPVWAYGYTYVLQSGPDLVAGLQIQRDNHNPQTKIPLKKSWQIRSNYLGATAPRMPRTPENDYLPLEPINLIDGDLESCWSSRTKYTPDAEPAWVRVDLSREQPIAKIVLRKRQPVRKRSDMRDPGAVDVGRGMPGQLTIRLSRDGQHWQTVFDGQTHDEPGREMFTCEFAPQPAKQIWIIGTELARVENWLYAFSIAEVEICDPQGRNLALASRGAGVTVSSTQHSMGNERETHRWLWPIHCDLGLKWVRVGYHDDPINWHWVEKHKGELRIDPETDAAITYLAERGVNVVFALGFGNRLYTQADPRRKLPQLWEWYYELPAPPTTKEALRAWDRYVTFIADHFRDRVRYFEIWNEWNIGCYWGAQPNFKHYQAILERTIPILRKHCPSAKVMLGSYGGFTRGISRWTPAQTAKAEKEHPFVRAVKQFAGRVDVIGWHPFYQEDVGSDYAEDLLAFKDYCARQGFRGEYIASEYTFGANYPPTKGPNWWGETNFTELQKAKCVAQVSALHTGLGVGSFFCETWNSHYPLDLSLLRRTFAADPISPLQPQAAYYVLRNLATALDGLTPASFRYQTKGGPPQMQVYRLAGGAERALVLFRSGRPQDEDPGVPCDIRLWETPERVKAIDPMNGVSQDLMLATGQDGLLLRGILVKDYPLILWWQAAGHKRRG
jgi:hypothetical protein